MAIKSYTNIRTTIGELGLKMDQQRTILRALEYAIKHNPNITRWSDEVDLFTQMTEAYKQQLQALADDLEYQMEYNTPRDSGVKLYDQRKTEEGEAA